MIKIIATGNIGKDAELKQIGGNNYACFSIAITEKVKGESRTTWVDVVKYDKEGKLTPYLKKGVRVQVIGKPTMRPGERDRISFYRKSTTNRHDNLP